MNAKWKGSIPIPVLDPLRLPTGHIKMILLGGKSIYPNREGPTRCVDRHRSLSPTLPDFSSEKIHYICQLRDLARETVQFRGPRSRRS
jgi:hypothetical protein